MADPGPNDTPNDFQTLAEQVRSLRAELDLQYADLTRRSEFIQARLDTAVNSPNQAWNDARQDIFAKLGELYALVDTSLQDIAIADGNIRQQVEMFSRKIEENNVARAGELSILEQELGKSREVVANMSREVSKALANLIKESRSLAIQQKNLQGEIVKTQQSFDSIATRCDDIGKLEAQQKLLGESIANVATKQDVAADSALVKTEISNLDSRLIKFEEETKQFLLASLDQTKTQVAEAMDTFQNLNPVEQEKITVLKDGYGPWLSQFYRQNGRELFTFLRDLKEVVEFLIIVYAFITLATQFDQDERFTWWIRVFLSYPLTTTFILIAASLLFVLGVRAVRRSLGLRGDGTPRVVREKVSGSSVKSLTSTDPENTNH